ncbi:MAG: PTS sugar transporter subunit IIA, partial [Traorella sp.]
ERLKNHMTIRNPLVNDNMRRYLFATKITHSICEIIEQFYYVEVDLNEFGYLLLYVNLEVIRFELNKPIKIALLSGRGRPEAVMIAYEIKERFSSHKYQIEEVKKVKPNTYDLAISTYKVDEQCDCPIIIINNDNYIEIIREKLNELRYQRLDLSVFCKEEYCTFNLDGATKEEVLHNFYQELKRKQLIKDIPDKNIKLLDDELGNGIVHFQDSYRIIKKNMFYVCTLKKSIFWGKDMVRILILIKTKKEYDKDLYNICRVVSKWANDITKVNKLLKNQNFNDLLEDLKEKL